MINPLQFTNKEEFLKAHSEAAAKAAETDWAEAEPKRRLANLHTELGFKSTQQLINALSSLAAEAPKKPAEGRRPRTTITAEIKARIKELSASGMKAPSIGKELGISVPSVYNILKA